MQDRETGHFLPVADLLQQSKDAVLPREWQGVCFTVGEIVDVKGTKFKVHHMRRKMLILESIVP